MGEGRPDERTDGGRDGTDTFYLVVLLFLLKDKGSRRPKRTAEEVGREMNGEKRNKRKGGNRKRRDSPR